MRELSILLADLTSGDDALAEAAALELSQYGEAALPAIKSLLSAEDTDHRWWAVRTLAQFGNSTLELMLVALEDAHEEIRQCAALVLASNPDVRAVPALIRALSDSDRMVASLAANALIAVGKDAVDGLVETVQQGSQATRLEAIRALAEIKDHRAIPVLMSAMEEESALMQYWAETGLNNLGLDMVYFKTE